MTKKANDIIVKGKELLDYIKRIIEKGNVSRFIIKKTSGKKILEIPLTAGVGIGSLLFILAPVLVVISSVAAWFAEFRVEVIHVDNTNTDNTNTENADE